MSIVRKKDKNGSYYQGSNNVKYYYQTGNTLSREKAKQKAKQTNGKGIINNIKGRLTLTPRNGPSPQFRQFLAKEGNDKIKNIYIARAPVQSGIQSFLNGISLGGFNKVKKNYIF